MFRRNTSTAQAQQKTAAACSAQLHAEIAAFEATFPKRQKFVGDHFAKMS